MTRFSALCGALIAVAGLADDPVDIAFKQFIERFHKKYSSEEYELRRTIFAKNLKYITKENEKGTNSYTLGVQGPFSDLEFEEFKETYMGYKKMNGPIMKGQESPRLTKEDIDSLPESVDWVAEGAVSSVKNQGACGSCWSFSAVGALEGAFAISQGRLIELSEQQLLDCDNNDGRCNGGLMDMAFTYVKKHGICTAKSYQYKCIINSSWECKDSKRHPRCAECDTLIQPLEVNTYVDVTPKSEDDLKAALAKQPVSVAIQADAKAFQFYEGGVLDGGGCGHDLDHGVLSVGYGTSSEGKDYFKIKNSWGSFWGENGYIKVQRNAPNVPEEGTCGILMAASYPVYTPLNSDTHVEETLIQA